ncbi:PilN domain-containing protein [Cellulomonas sp. HD19AZ1]|uniref:PilN domain-containing protein n=1 Tax=Cellulomonas TaxID=1707 RepID=UPI001070A49F|nr:PilN domain-containing protein [Cellulomonas sp. HD19AZ1]TFH69545.1 fimbrial assembly protein [Cellulomonas sp. HD19AZ1]
MNAALAPTRTDAPAAAPTVARVPQVNLLPAEVAAAHGLRAVRRWSLLGFCTVVLVLCLGYAYSAFELAQARDDLRVAQDASEALVAEQATYAEVPAVLGEMRDVTSAQQFATSTEVLWRPYLEQIRAVLPDGAELRTLQVVGATPVLPAAPPTDSLQAASIGQLALTARTSSVPHAADWTDALGGIDGFSDPRVQSVSQEEGQEGERGYLVTMTVQYDESALAGRFATTEEGR